MPPQEDETSYLFAGYRLEPLRGMLFDPAGHEVRLRPKPFALLRHLLDHPGVLLGRDELFEALWPGVVVSDDSLTQCVSELRRALGDAAPSILRTVSRRGYMLAAEVRRRAPTSAGSPPAPPAEAARSTGAATRGPMQTLALARCDTLTILPVAVPHGDETAASLAPALASDLLTELVRFEDLRVVAGPRGGVVNGFLLHTDLHAAGGAFRLSLRLENSDTGTSFWADRIEWPAATGVPSLAAITTLAATIDLQIARKSLRRAQDKARDELTARELILIGRNLYETEDDTAGALALFVRAASVDPGYGATHAWHAVALMRLTAYARDEAGRQAQTVEAVRVARMAVRSDPASALSRSALALALAVDGRTKEAADEARLGLRFSAVTQHGTRTACAEALAVAGHSEEAVEALRETLAFDPHCPPRTRAVLGRSLLLADQLEDALSELRLCAAQMPDFVPCQGSIVVAAIETGRFDEARAALAQMRRLHPEWVASGKPSRWFLRRPEDLARFEKAFSVAVHLDSVAASGGLMTPSATAS
jgi:DNA-binding winged helix-turn-helix (wHTH) protein/tetratricopeptide (TPR) repeat protein